MSESEPKNTFREEFEAHLNSPKPLLMRFRNTIFGRDSPDTVIQSSFFLSLFIWFIFFIWSLLSLLVIWSRFWIEHNKNLPVSELISNRGLQLGFGAKQFLERLESFHLISICIWVVIFIGLVLVWRKHPAFKWFVFGGATTYLIVMWVLLGFNYWYFDTTAFDKIAFLAFIVNSSIYTFFFRKKVDKSIEFITEDT